ncbi:hypothetical protein AFERRI_410007 [Acidithiobacillus ferrivorans]|uniref:Uncharacterized protein n=1 Tax=Acidithiobacillus ferrivorans TaxID=160808 RepID=A0A060UVU4_9PROT|nr:hypothetical protein AFERRI_410007 [Acidithiobacillus ferrivorans]
MDEDRRPDFMKQCVRTFHHRSNGKSGIATALATSISAGARGYSPGIANLCTISADRPARPAQPLKVICTSIGIWEHPLKLGQKLRKRKVIVLKNVHLHRLKSYPHLLGTSTGQARFIDV